MNNETYHYLDHYVSTPDYYATKEDGIERLKELLEEFSFGASNAAYCEYLMEQIDELEKDGIII